MDFYRALYFSPNIEHRGKVKRQLQSGKSSLTLYVLTLCDLSLTQREPLAENGRSNLRAEESLDNSQEKSAAGSTILAKTGNQLQFFHSFFLKSKNHREHCPMIVGIADGRGEAVKLVQRIVEETWKTDGDYDIVRFLARRDRRIRVPDPAEAVDPGMLCQGNDKVKAEMGTPAGTPGD